jgi:hypothetical protein
MSTINTILTECATKPAILSNLPKFKILKTLTNQAKTDIIELLITMPKPGMAKILNDFLRDTLVKL